MVPPEIEQWVKRKYPKPRLDPDWLQACYNYLIEELQISADDTNALTENIEAQLLQSDLADSTMSRSGLPSNVAKMHGASLPPFLLLQVVSCAEIGHSAFSLQNIRQAWVDKEDLSGLAGEEEGDEPADGDHPRYPRSMLSLELSDGYTILKAIEYRRLNALALGQVPLGFKIVLKSVPVRRGVALLQPSNVELRGYQNDELDVHREAVFLRGLRTRMGLPPEDEAEPEREPQVNGRRSPRPEPAEPAPPSPVQRAVTPRASPPVAARPSRAGSSQPSRPVQSPYFNDIPPAPPSVRLSPLHSRSEELYPAADDDDIIDIDRFVDIDDEPIDEGFLRQIDMVEREAIHAPQRGGPSRQTQDDPIMIDDSNDDEKENVPVKVTKRARRRTEADEVIELSD